MNKRIRALAEQAGALVTERSGWTDYGTLDFDIEKFAELIVKECADVLDEAISPPNHPMNSIGFKLKQHFGVGE